MPLCAQPCPHQGTDTSKKDHVFAQFCCHSSGLKMVHDAQKIRSPKWRYSPIEAFCRGIPSPITSSIYLKSMVNKVPKQKIEETKKPKMSLNHGFCLPHIWPAKKGNPPAQAWRVLKTPRSWGFLDQIYGSCMLMYCITSLLNHMPFCCRKKTWDYWGLNHLLCCKQACRWFFLLPILTAREYSSWEAASSGLKRSNRWMILVGSLWIIYRFFTCRSLQSWTRTVRQPEVSRMGSIEPEGYNNSRYSVPRCLEIWHMMYDMALVCLAFQQVPKVAKGWTIASPAPIQDVRDGSLVLAKMQGHKSAHGPVFAASKVFGMWRAEPNM